MLGGARRRLLRAIPDAVLREAVVNAIAHRHYRLPAQPTVVHATPESFTVRLPGDFVPGVNPTAGSSPPR